MSQSTWNPLGQSAIDRGIALIRQMGEDFGEIIAGTEKERAACRLFVDELTRLGVRTTVHDAPGLVSEPGEGTLEVLVDGESPRTVDCAVFAQSEPTPAGGVEAEVVHIGAGGLDDYPEDAVRGKIALTELSYAPPRPEKARIAKERGAIALVMVNWGGDDNPAVPRGTVKCVWGNPTRRDLGKIETLPAVGISRRDGVQLRDLARAGRLRARLTTTVTREWRTLKLPVGWIDAGGVRDDGRDFVLVAGHYDSWGGGVTDNHSGNVGQLLIAEALQEARGDLCRDVAIAFWPGHESGIMAGSTWFVDRHWDLLASRCVAHLNLDSLGMDETQRWEAAGAVELKALVDETVAEFPEHKPLRWIARPPKTGDQSLMGLGIPSIVARSGPDPEQIAAQNGAVLGEWYHSDLDTFDKLDQRAFAHDVRILVRYVSRLASEPVLPLTAGAVGRQIVERLDELSTTLAGHSFDADANGLDWSALRGLAGALQEELERLDGAIDGVRADATDRVEAVRQANDCLRALARTTTPVRYTAVHRHDQDTYGESRLSHVLPELDVVVELASAAADDAHVLWTEAARARNRLYDALAEAREQAGEACSELAGAGAASTIGGAR